MYWLLLLWAFLGLLVASRGFLWAVSPELAMSCTMNLLMGLLESAVESLSEFEVDFWLSLILPSILVPPMEDLKKGLS